MKRRIICFFSILLTIATSIFAQQEQTATEQMKAYLEETDSPITAHNRIHLLRNGQEKFDNLFAELRKAKHHIHLEYFNLRNDSITKELMLILAEKCQEGVEVRVLFDAFGNFSNNAPLKKKHLAQIRENGIDIQVFDPIRFPYINNAFHRDHRKIAVIDGKIGYVGGMNVADYYINGLPEVGDWHDTHIRMEGEVVALLQDIFLKIWNKQTKQHIGGEVYYPIDVYRGTDMEKDSLNSEVSIVDREPKVSPRAITRAYNAAIRSAQKRVLLVNPYFVPTKSIKRAIKDAAKRGVDVEIMIPAKSDIKFTPDAMMTIAHRLEKKGVKVYLFNGGFNHSKVMMVDDEFCTVGTANLNSRSLRFDYETNAFIFSRDITQLLTDDFEDNKADSTPMDADYWKHKRSAGKKIVGWFASLFAFTL